MSQTETEKNNKRKEDSKKRKRRIILGIFLLLLIIIAILIWLYLQRPGVSQNIRVIEPVIEKNPEIIMKRFEGDYLSFALRDSYVLKRHTEEDQSGVVLERVFFSEREINSKKIALTVYRLADGGLEENPDYKMRKMYAGKYQQGRFQSGGIAAEFFSVFEASHFERVYFLTKDGYLAEIGFSAPSEADEELKAEADAIGRSVRWKSE